MFLSIIFRTRHMQEWCCIMFHGLPITRPADVSGRYYVPRLTNNTTCWCQWQILCSCSVITTRALIAQRRRYVFSSVCSSVSMQGWTEQAMPFIATGTACKRDYSWTVWDIIMKLLWEHGMMFGYIWDATLVWGSGTWYDENLHLATSEMRCWSGEVEHWQNCLCAAVMYCVGPGTYGPRQW